MENLALAPRPELFRQLCELIETLRGPEGCPWDRRQAPRSIIEYLLEEVYELADAVAAAEPSAVSEELGDVLFLLLFLVQLYREEKKFGLDSVLRNVHAKMVRRHPHVFGGLEVADSAEVRRNWARIKQEEKPSSGRSSAVDRIPRATPALSRACRIWEAVAGAGLDRRTDDEIRAGADEAFADLKGALRAEAPQDPRMLHSAYGNLLWALVALGRSAGVQPEAALSDVLDTVETRIQTLSSNGT